MIRNLPDTEETKDMVDAVGREVFCHLAETSLPPMVLVFLHHLPVVGGHSPILSVGGKSIGRSSCLPVHIEIIRLYPCLHAVAADTYRDITFHDDSLAASVGAGIKQLYVQVVLQK